MALSGASRGCGAALARELAAAGHTVLGCARDAERLAALEAELGAPHRMTPTDVSDDAQVAAWAEAVAAEGVPDLVIANAGLINRSAPLWELSADEVGAVIDVNVKGVAHMARRFLPPMIARGRGVFVAFSSGWGRSTAPEVAPYCASKFAVEGMISALAQELPAGLAAVAVNPGIIDTEMLRSCWAEGAASFPAPEVWARGAAPFLTRLGPADSGRQRDAP